MIDGVGLILIATMVLLIERRSAYRKGWHEGRADLLQARSADILREERRKRERDRATHPSAGNIPDRMFRAWADSPPVFDQDTVQAKLETDGER